MNKIVDVSCAVIRHKGKVLIAQRSKNMAMPLKWEFPGGKVKEEESIEQSLIREISEELNILISIDYKLTPIKHKYAHIHIRLHPFACSFQAGNIYLSEHQEIRWVDPQELLDYDWAAADIPIVQEVTKIF